MIYTALNTDPERVPFEQFMRESPQMAGYDLARFADDGYANPVTKHLFDCWIAARYGRYAYAPSKEPQ